MTIDARPIANEDLDPQQAACVREWIATRDLPRLALWIAFRRSLDETDERIGERAIAYWPFIDQTAWREMVRAIDHGAHCRTT